MLIEYVSIPCIYNKYMIQNDTLYQLSLGTLKPCKLKNGVDSIIFI